ncbi:hypothetical protein KAFR_0G03860 [Kazachstania africana CBS 2517]|uniref:Uncharacterized protein n=1 Tax=Kazachstania africana (strain ATCC 22294 / BCRC 22015 / CBS 2517 / CECT 1963 / NBRC 1671 / NRRL Y-8276) TaxID=1071382 RepID=H2AYG9_KAZAF|nr:hypothetical protein KAFR_0G03860 [Kazachstania africana CBS 2517]CCF59419.1 hypothetical protein KAFR_0G03860 [Kazachstania africana CBS 2517]
MGIPVHDSMLEPTETYWMLSNCLSVFGFSGINKEESQRVVDDINMGRHFYGYFKTLYSKVMNEEDIAARNLVTTNLEKGSVSLGTKTLSLNFISRIKIDLHIEFDTCQTALREWFIFGSPPTAYMTVLDNKNIELMQEDPMTNSIFKILPQCHAAQHYFKWRRPEDASVSEIRTKVVKLINKMTKLLMASVWISTGFPVRFTELSILSVGGTSRNLYIDSDTRLFYFRVTYNKNKKFDNRIFMMDLPVTRNLFWFVYILRPFEIELLSKVLDVMDSSMLIGHFANAVRQEIEDEAEELLATDGDEFNEETNQLVETSEALIEELRAKQAAGLAIMCTFIFVDVERFKLVTLSIFNGILLKYPKKRSARENMKISDLRQCLAGLWKRIIRPSLEGDVVPVRTPALFGHSKQTHEVVYGVNPSRDFPTNGSFDNYYAYKKLAQEFQSLTQYTLVQTKRTFEALAVEPQERQCHEPEAGIYDLLKADGELFEDFEFKSSAQERFTSAVLNSNERFWPFNSHRLWKIFNIYSVPLHRICLSNIYSAKMPFKY